MSESMIATDPCTSATVSASAGTGKTWLLVTRLIRLLLSGAKPEGIIAVTFTRKAAAEMQTRLNERLFEMANCSDDDLTKLLDIIESPKDSKTIHLARTLYEKLLSAPYAIRTTTFHSFCQEILRKFPMEANIAPGFELLESTEDIKREAWNAVCAKASLNPEDDMAKILGSLLDDCGGLSNTLTSINNFLNHRSDWWAFTETQSDPLKFATKTLSSQLKIKPDENPEQEFFTPEVLDHLTQFISLLHKHPGKTNNEVAQSLTHATDPDISFNERFQETIKAFLTKAGEPRKRKESAAQEKNMGKAGQQMFLEIHNIICDAINDTNERIFKLKTYQRTCTWYQAGLHVLDHYQLLKSELRVLDFADLEWRAYLLLNHGDNVHWIQYKLDQRIDHLLIDEFQDTNPTQWRLILPLLEELAAGINDRNRSVFLVGDNKQSIYRFRRADPELFDTAQSWLNDNLAAKSQPLDISWRSADAIMNFVNRLFGDGPLNQHMVNFSEHTTHFPKLWGKVEILPLIELTDDDLDIDEISHTDLRDPLLTPRILDIDERYLEEGRLISEKINTLVNNKTLIGPTNNARPVRYSDIIILIRNRTNAADYEQALKESNIPYMGANRGTLLNSLEISDMVNLLELLIAPFNNLALASVLRSPLFDCSEEDLILLARQTEGNWIDRLSVVAQQDSNNHKNSINPASNNIQRANKLLSQWRKLTGKIPVHDLLDRIFCEGDLINRYQAAYPPQLQQSVTANLTRFIELALEIDSGRHPTIGRFVSRLRSLGQQSEEAPDEGSPIQADSRVRLMTIHASKGLEAPVIFLADAAFSSSRQKPYQTIVDWPAQKMRPDCFLLTGTKNIRDQFTSNVLDRHAHAEDREEANLLYVAVTRAKQLLYISGCRPKKNSDDLGWYGHALNLCKKENGEDCLVFESGNYPERTQLDEPVDEIAPPPDIQLSTPIQNICEQFIIAPSHLTGTLNQLPINNDEHTNALLREEARAKGIVIHRCLQLLSENIYQVSDDDLLLQHISGEINLVEDEEHLHTWIREATEVFTNPDLSHIFNNESALSSYNEVPIQYHINEKMVYGVIDRLVITQNEAWVIDYKTHRVSSDGQTKLLTEQYSTQIKLYCDGVKRLWPDKKTRGFLLLTHRKQIIELE